MPILRDSRLPTPFSLSELWRGGHRDAGSAPPDRHRLHATTVHVPVPGLSLPTRLPSCNSTVPTSRLAPVTDTVATTEIDDPAAWSCAGWRRGRHP